MKEIKRYLEGREGKYSFFFEDLNSGYVYGYNENVQMVSAGCMKLPVAMILLKKVEEGEFRLEDNIFIKEEDKYYGTGILHEFAPREYTLKELMVAMLIQSDNTASNKIINMLGKERINATFQEIGLQNTVLNRESSNELESEEKENRTTSYDLCKCWKILHDKLYINEQHSNMLIDILSKQQFKSKSSLYIFDELKDSIANKTGDKRSVENDTMLVRLNKGDFTFTIMSRDIPNSVYGMVSLAKAGKMMWDSINNCWI